MIKKARTHPYSLWIKQNEPDDGELSSQTKENFAFSPLISITVPVYNTRIEHFRSMVDSVVRQTYPNWELCLADGGSTNEELIRLVNQYAESDRRIKVAFLGENRGISGNSNAAIEMASGEFIALLDHDDIIPPFALFEVVKLLNNSPDTDFIYSDQDFLSANGLVRSTPLFKPDWSPDFLRACNYISHFSVIRKEAIDRIGGFRPSFDGSQDYDLFFRLSEQGLKIRHIPKILYHWRMHEESTSINQEAKTYAFEAGVKSIEEHLSRIGLAGEVLRLNPGYYDIKYKIPPGVKVSIIIPNKDNAGILKKCIESIFSKSTYRNFEVLVVENNSRDKETFEYYSELESENKARVIHYHGIFNYSAINNFAVGHAHGEVLLFLNNDIEVISPDWVERMLGFALRQDVGAVGALLCYPDGTVQHGGVLVGMRGTAAHYHANKFKGQIGYFSRLVLAHDVSAVTGACLMMRKDVFREVGGFDERYEVVFGDVDLCLKARQKKLLVVFTPYAELMHHESKTRGIEDTPERVARFNKEAGLLKSSWPEIYEKGDPYYNPNLSLQFDFEFKISSKWQAMSKSVSTFFIGLPLIHGTFVFIVREYSFGVRPRLIKLVDSLLPSSRARRVVREFYYRIARRD